MPTDTRQRSSTAAPFIPERAQEAGGAWHAGPVRDISERYDLPDNTGTLREQFGSLVRKIWRLRKPDGSGGPDTLERVELHSRDAPIDQDRMDGTEVPLAASRHVARKRRERRERQMAAAR